jgi:hypothetical protein
VTVGEAVRSKAPLLILVVGGVLVVLAMTGLFGYSVTARRSARLGGVLCLPLFVLTGFSTGPAFLLGAFLLLAGTDESHWTTGRELARS